MTEKEKIRVDEIVQSEGFEYTFLNYSSFRDIKDEKFHQLRQAYIAAKLQLEEYITPKAFLRKP
jgi:hypothetical protein